MLLLNYRLLLRETINDFNAQHFLVLVVAAQCNRAGHYIFALWFLLVLSMFFSSPNLSGRRVDDHTSTHGVALVRI